MKIELTHNKAVWKTSGSGEHYRVPCNEYDSLRQTVVLLDRFLSDLERHNPGFMGKLVIDNYMVYNEAMIARTKAIQILGGVK